jgi:hypothetical protein
MEKESKDLMDDMLEKAKKKYELDGDFASKIKYQTLHAQVHLKKEKDDFWLNQSKLDVKERMLSYQSRCQKFIIKNGSATEKDFLFDEMEDTSSLMSQVDKYNDVQKKAFFHLKKYNELLKDRLEDIIAEENELKGEEGKAKPLAFDTNRAETVVTLLLLRECGILGKMKDYRLAKFAEENILCSGNKPMKKIMNEISAILNNAKSYKKLEKSVKEKVLKAEIKVNK